ncbi:MAG: PepSY domain-containing protein [Nitrospira sp.]|nr:PepSY domain-containing protein [Nitrospira sp.]
MNWLHTYSGLLFGWALFAVFFTGTLTVFDNEMTDWMQPELQEATAKERERSALDEIAPASTLLVRQVGNENTDVFSKHPLTLMVKLQKNRGFSGQTTDPETGELIIFRDTQGGDFFYHFHHGLLLGFPGAWIVATAGMVMLVSLTTGLSVHRRSFRDLLVFRPQFFPHRTWLDAHNLTGLLVLPFHLMITVTGLLIFWSIYVSAEFQFLSADSLALSLVSTLHFVQFGGVSLRWLYFFMGLVASIMIATGLVMWVIKRRKYYLQRPVPLSYRLVESLNVTTLAGLPVATAAFLWANRLLPVTLPGRSHWEEGCFFLAWGLCFIHSLLRRGPFAWKDQLYVAGLLFGFLPLLNGLTTGSHLLRTVPNGSWGMAAVDLTAAAAGVFLCWAGRRISRAGAGMSTNRPGSGTEVPQGG